MTKSQDVSLQEKVEALELKSLPEVIENGDLGQYVDLGPAADTDSLQENYQWVRKNNVYTTEYLQANNLEYLQEKIISH